MQAALWSSSDDGSDPASIADLNVSLRGVEGPVITGSTSAVAGTGQTSVLSSGWPLALFVVGVSGLTGLGVLLFVSKLVPSKPDEADSEPSIVGKRADHKISDNAEIRRWRGGPIRN